MTKHNDESILNEMKSFLDKCDENNDFAYLERSKNSFLNTSLNTNISNKELINSFENQIDSSSVLNHPKYAQYFKKRVCIKYVSDPK